MSNIPHWSHALSVRNAQLDEQHIILTELSKELISLARNESLTDTRILEVLQEFAGYAKRHYELEESVLAANQCPTLDEHTKTHRTAEEELKRWIDAAKSCRLDRPAIGAYFEDWMQHHLAETDMPAKEYLSHTVRRA